MITAASTVLVLGYDRYTGGRDSVVGLLAERLRLLRLKEEQMV